MDRRKKLSIITVVLAMLGALFATAGIAAGNGPVFVDKGRLDLHTGDSGYTVKWYPAGSASATQTQTLNVNAKCDVSSSGPNLITLTPTGGNGKVGAVSHGLGVKTKNNCSTEQGQVAEGQTLKVSLGSFFNSKIRIEFAEVDIEGKRNAQLAVTYSDNSSEIRTLSNTSDNGPDSGSSDNNLIRIPATGEKYTTSLRFNPVMAGTNSPAIAVEGGGDGTNLINSFGTNASAFKLVEEFDGELNCGESTPTEGDGITNAAITVMRGGQVDCVLKPYNDDSAGSTASFEPTGQANAQFAATIVWPAETTQLPVPVTKIDFDGPTGPLPVVPVQWCTGTAERNPDGTLAMYPADSNDGYIDYAFIDPPELPAGASWCLLDQDVSYVNGGKMQVTEYYYGTGDPFFAR